MIALGLFLTYDCNQRCPYCFKKREDKTLSAADFQIFHDWFVENGFGRVIVAGGEPTQHPEFERFVSALKARTKPSMQIITNLVCAEEKLEAFRDCDVLVNTSPPHSQEDRATFEMNLGRLVATAGTRVILSCTLWKLDQEDEHIVRYCRELGISRVRIDFARASLQRENEYVTLDRLEEFKKKALALGERLAAEGVWVGFDCPVPTGTFSKDEIRRLKLEGFGTMDPEQLVCHHLLFVNPDLTISACPFRGISQRRLDEFEDTGDLAVTVAAAIKDRMKDGRAGPFLCMAERLLKGS